MEQLGKALKFDKTCLKKNFNSAVYMFSLIYHLRVICVLSVLWDTMHKENKTGRFHAICFPRKVENPWKVCFAHY